MDSGVRRESRVPNVQIRVLMVLRSGFSPSTQMAMTMHNPEASS
jgi:hypothetical protein